MGHTHYWTHTRRFKKLDWSGIKTDISMIMATAAEDGIELGNAFGEPTTTDRFAEYVHTTDNGEQIAFNGLGEDSLETFAIWQNRRPLEDWQEKSRRGWDFCKTGRNAYDVAVMACLIYLESRFPDHFGASSDGDVDDWNAGLDLARRALPRLGNVLNIPAEVRFSSMFDRFHLVGGKYAIATTTEGKMCLTDNERLSILGTFETEESIEWVTNYIRRVMDERRRKLPCAVKTLDRWEARKMRTFREAAESFDYLTLSPVEE